VTETIDPRFLDKRTAEHYIRLGLLDEKVWDRYLKSLPDVGEKGVEVETAIGVDEDLEEDDGDAVQGGRELDPTE
jgi:hypothetical protein